MDGATDPRFAGSDTIRSRRQDTSFRSPVGDRGIATVVAYIGATWIDDFVLASGRDPLTGLLNRRFFEDALERALNAAAPFCVLTLDVDHFKRVNDTHGHAAGDTVLRQVARTLPVHFRLQDVVARFGGEEFSILVLGGDVDASRRRAERLRKTVAALRPTVETKAGGRLRLPMTVSVGIAAFPHDGNTAESILAAADRRLYRAKRTGRDRVESPEVATGPTSSSDAAA